MNFRKSSLVLLYGKDMLESERDYKNLLLLKKQWFKIKLMLSKLETKERLKKVKKIYPKRRAVWPKIPSSLKH